MGLEATVIPAGPLSANCIFVWDVDTREGLLFDPGGEDAAIGNFIKHMGLKVLKIVLTHGHFDHCFGAWHAKALTGASICMHPADKPILKGNAQLATSWGIKIPASYQTEVDEELADGQDIKFGGHTLRVISTPGHSPGSCCFYEPNEHILISGDTLFAGSVGRTDLPLGSPEALGRSVRHLRELLGDNGADCVVYPGHGGQTRATAGNFRTWLAMTE